MIIARFVGTGGFLIRYSNGQMKHNANARNSSIIIINKSLFL